VRRDDGHFELVSAVELGGFRLGRAGHAGEFFVEAEIVLQGDGGERLVLALDLDALFRLDRLMESVRPAAAGHRAPRELVHDDHLALFDEVMVVETIERVRLQSLFDAVEHFHVRRVVEVADAEQAFGLVHALFR